MSDTDFALVITDTYNLQKITKSGPTGTVDLSVTALNVSVCANGTIWIVSENPVQNTGGGAALMVSTDGGSTYALPGGQTIGAGRVAGAPDGSCWFISEDNAISSVTAAGTVTSIAPENTAFEIAIGAQNRVWILSTDVNTTLGGNSVKLGAIGSTSFADLPGNPIAKKISAWQDGSCWIVTVKGEVGFIETNGTTGLLSTADDDIALQIGISPNMGTCWIVGTDVVSSANVIKYWDASSTASSAWPTVPGAEGIAVSGGG